MKSAALAYLGPDDHTMEGGLVVTAKGRCFLFTLEFGTGEAGEGTGSYREAWLWDWEEVDRSQLQGYDGAAASAAEAILDDEE